jgi:hypothetical protein
VDLVQGIVKKVKWKVLKFIKFWFQYNMIQESPSTLFCILATFFVPFILFYIVLKVKYKEVREKRKLFWESYRRDCEKNE